MTIQGAVVIVTGASSGIGAATARELARQGALVVLAARRADKLRAVVAEIEVEGGRALAVPTDVSRRPDIDRLVQAAIEAHGRIDALVNNAGVGGGSSIFDDDARLQQVVEVNLLAPARLIQAVVPAMRQQGGGVIVNIGSVAGDVGVSGLYSATKSGLHGLSDAARRELRRYHIRVVVIAPGFIRSEMTAGMAVPIPGPAVVARAVAAAIRHPRRKIVVPGFYAPLVLLARALPGFADWVIGSTLFQRLYHGRH